MSVVTERLSTVLTGQLKVKQELLDTDVTLGALSFDSLVLIELGLILEKEFGVRLVEGDLSEQLTVGGLAGLLTEKGAA
jgi:acyl carrier protein